VLVFNSNGGNGQWHSTVAAMDDGEVTARRQGGRGTERRTQMPQSIKATAAAMAGGDNGHWRLTAAMDNGRGSGHKIVNFFLLQTLLLVLDHVYIQYMTSHIKFGLKIPPTTKIMGCNILI
jgi:hypothetical protein